MLAALRRFGYLADMYSGLRGVRATLCSRLVQVRPSARGPIHGQTQHSLALGVLRCWVHARRAPCNQDNENRAYGMISLRLWDPALHPLVYRYFCLTSHFGQGHLEAAFYEENGRCVVYALRNTARANASRLGLKGLAQALAVSRSSDETVILREVERIFAPHFSSVVLAHPAETLRLAVDERLLDPKRRQDALRGMKARYRRVLASAPEPCEEPER